MVPVKFSCIQVQSSPIRHHCSVRFINYKPVSTLLSAGPVIPKYYYVQKDDLERERANPGSQTRVSSSDNDEDNIFLWGQSVYLISQLLCKL